MSVILAAAASLFGSLILLWVYTRLYQLDGQRYIRIWAYAWAASTARYTLIIFAFFLPESALISIAIYLGALGTGYFLLWGTYEFLGRSIPQPWLVAFGAVGLWMTAAVAARLPFAAQTLPVFALLAVASLVIGLAILRAPEAGQRVTGWAYVVWAIHRLNYPFLRNVEWFAPIGFAMAAFLELVIAVGTLLIYFERTRRHLADSEARYQSLFEDALEGMYRLAPDGRFMMANPALVRMLGYESVDEVLALRWEDDVMVERAAPPRCDSLPLAMDGVECQWRKRDGQPITVQVFGQAVLDDKGGIAYYEGLVQDITERKRIEAAERQQRLLAEALRDTIGALSRALELDRVLDLILEQVARLIPHDAATIVLIEDDVARVARARGYDAQRETIYQISFHIHDDRKLVQMLRDDQPYVIKDTAQDPNWRLMPETAWIRSHVGVPIFVERQLIGIINLDSREMDNFHAGQIETLRTFADQAGIAIRNAWLYDAVRRQASDLEARVVERTAQLAREQAQLRAILDAISEGVIGVIMNEAGQVVYRYTNRAFHDLLGYGMDEWDPQAVFAVGITREAFAQNWMRMVDAVTRDGIWEGDTRARRKDGSILEAHVTITGIRGVDGRVIGAVTIIRDISQEKALQEQKSRFVASASHELRTPITNLKTRLYLARRKPEQLDKHLDVMDEVINRMAALVNDLLDLSRFERGIIELRRADLEVAPIITAVINTQRPEAERKHINLACQLPDMPLRAWMDGDRIHQVLTNLVTNAIAYTPEGGSVTIEAQMSENASGRCYIGVRDTGTGIPPEHLPHIFEPFYRAHKDGQGMGLGLSIAREIVALHGGEMTVSSEPGRGTCFQFWLPQQRPAAG